MAAAARDWEPRGMNRFLLTASSALAAPGDLDSTFSGDGKDLIDLGADDVGGAVAIQPDGKIVLATSSVSKTSGQGDFVVLRTNPDGSPDDTFSGDGQIRFSFAEADRSSDDRATSVALGPNGSIVVAGITNAGAFGNDMAV